MAQAPRTLQPYSSLRHFFGAELRRWRAVRGLSQDELGRRTHHSGDLIGKVEKAQRRPTVALAASCDRVLATGGALSRLMGLLLAQDGGATSVRRASVEAQLLLDGTDRWAGERRLRDVSHGDVRRLPAVRGWDTSAADPGDFVRFAGAAWFGMLPMDDEDLPGSARVPMSVPDRIEQAHIAALRRSIAVFENWDHQFGGGLARAAMSGQLEWSCRVLRGSSMTSEVRRGWQAAAARLGDVVGWACFDAGEDDAAHGFFLLAMQLAGEADDVQQRAHVATSMSRQLTYLGHASQALQVVDLARLGIRKLPRVGRAVLHIVEARAYARMRDAQACLRAVGGCDEEFDASAITAEEDDTWGYYTDEGQVLGDAGHALFDLAMVTGDPGHADTTRRRLEAAHATHPPTASRSKALTMIRVASLAARHGDVDGACSAAERSLPDAGQVWSRRVADDLRQLDRLLADTGGRGIGDDRVHRVRERIETLTAV